MEENEKQTEKQIKTIQSVHRALDIWEYLIESGDGFPLSKIAEECNLNRTTAFHLLKTLQSRGYVEQSFDTQFYKLGWKSYEITTKIFAKQNIVRESIPYMEQLFHKFNETVFLVHCMQVDGHHRASCFYQIESTDPLHTSQAVGTLLPLFCTSFGRTYLMNLPDDILKAELSQPMASYTSHTKATREAVLCEVQTAKQKGYSVEYEEYQEGVCTVAVPIVKYTGRTIFSLVISIPSQRANSDRIHEILSEMLPISQELSKRPF